MKRFITTGLLVLGTMGGFWYAYSDEESRNIAGLMQTLTGESSDEDSQLNSTSFLGSDLFGSTPIGDGKRGAAGRIRIATFNVDLTAEKSGDAKRTAMLARIMKNFDVIALQGLRANNRLELNNLIDLMNYNGQGYAFVEGPQGDNHRGAHQFAFIYNQQRILTDSRSAYTVADPDNVFQNDPLVGWFRTREPDQQHAFTFSLVNVLIDTYQAEKEIRMLGQLYRAVRDDGRGEDDVILLGDFQAGDREFKYLNRQSRLSWIAREMTTDTEGSAQLDNLIFYPAASVEQTGRGGVFDFLKSYNLTISEAISVSPHLPVWAEFEIHESISPATIADQPQVSVREARLGG